MRRAVVVGLIFLGAFMCTTTVRGQEPLAPGGLSHFSYFGKSVAIDEPYIFVGQPHTTATNSSGYAYSSAGRVRVFVVNASGAGVEEDLYSSERYDSDEFGTAVAVSSNTLAVGAPGDVILTNIYCGKVYLFSRDDHNWNQTQILIPDDAARYIDFGKTVAMLPDWLFVGAPGQNTANGTNCFGCVYVYQRNSHGVYVLSQVLTRPVLQNGDAFGAAIAADGQRLAVAGLLMHGGVDTFVLSGGVWQHESEISAPDDYYYPFFGHSLALKGDRLLIGTSAGCCSSRAYIYEYAGGAWSQVAHMDGQANPPLNYADAVALNSQFALVMADVAGYLYQPSGTNWNLLATYALPPEDDGGGRSCAISENYFVLGVPRSKSPQTDSGNAYLYSMSSLPPGYPANPEPVSGYVQYTVPDTLSWSNGYDTASVSLYLGTNNPPTTQILTNVPAVSGITAPALAYDTTYYWRVVDYNANGSAEGEVWSFTTPLSPPSFGVNPTSISFGQVLVNTTSAPVSFCITNSGQKFMSGIVYVAPRFVLSYTNIQHGTVITNEPGEPASYYIQGGDSKDFNVRFAPVQAGNQDCHIRITSSDKNNPTNFIMITATGSLPTPGVPGVKEPADGETGVAVAGAWLHWLNGDNTTMVNLYLGTTTEPTNVLNHATALQDYRLGHLRWNTTYYWQVGCINDYGGVDGPMWHFTTEPEPAALQVVAPNGYERWPVGLPHEIIWARGPEKSVKIELLHDAGSGYSVYQTIDSDTDNDGTYDWTPAATVSNGNYRIRITATTDAGQTDESDSDFMVTTGLAVTVTSPDGGEVWRMGSTHAIQWASSGISSNLNIELYTTINGYTQLERVVAADVPDSGSYNWKIPTDERVDWHYLIAVSSVDYPEVCDFSDAVFTLTNAVALELTAPIPNARWSKESSRLIKWDTVGSVPHVDLYLLKSGADTLIEKNVANTNGYLWTIPDSLATGDDYRIFIQGYEDQSVSNVSGCFAITPKAGTITLATPESGARCEIGDVVTVKWDDENVIGPLKLELWSYGHYAATIVTNLTDSGSYDWNIAAGMPTGAVSQVRIVDCGNTDTYGLSAVFDLEQPAYLRLTSPDGGEAWQINQNHQITWVSSNMSDCIRIDLYENTELAKTIAAETRNTGSYVWSTSDLYPGTHYRVKISSCYHADINDMSDAEFELVKPLPEKPFYPSPSDGAGGVPATAVFSARFGSYTETCDVYFGTNNPPPTMILTNVPSASFRVCNMAQLQTYYWQVTARNSTGTMPGPVWQFTTRREPLRISAITRVSGGLRIEWNPVGKVLRYHVFGSDSLTNAFQDLGTCTTNSILEPGGSNTLHYFYRITADPQ